MSKSSRSKRRQKFQKIGFKPIHPLAPFKPIRKKMDLLKKFKICLADLFPPGAKLTGNESKVLFVLRAATVGSSNIAAIDQEKIAELTGLIQPNVARAIRGLRNKGVLQETWMEPGFQMYRNVYSLWAPPEITEIDAQAMLKQRDEARELEKKAERKEAAAKPKKARKLREQAQAVRETVCPICGGEGVVAIFSPKKGRDIGRWCTCYIGRMAAEKAGYPNSVFIPDSLFLEIESLSGYRISN
jgi:hypothetical protein